MRRNDAIDADEAERLAPSHLVVSPGPGRPASRGRDPRRSSARLGGRVPTLGVCLGHQAIVEALRRRDRPRRASSSTARRRTIQHDGRGRLPRACRRTSRPGATTRSPRRAIPDVLEVTATSADGEVMGVRHRELPVEGVQFHPESVLTPVGPAARAELPRGRAVIAARRLARLAATAASLDARARARGDGRDHGAASATPGADRRLPRRAAREGRDGRRDRRLRGGDARARAAGAGRRGTDLVDTAGTGGDGADTLNISTAAALVAAAAGAAVAKHGNRAVSSASGSADVLEALGFDLELPPERIARLDRRARLRLHVRAAHHPAMRHAAPVRRELATRTVFNVLGPLTNPARRAGAGRRRLLAAARAHDRRGARAARRAPRVRRPRRRRHRRALAGRPEPRLRGRRGRGARADDRPARARRAALRARGAARRRRRTRTPRDPRGLRGRPGGRRDAILLNAAGAIAAGGPRARPREGLALARKALDSGAAAARLEELVAFSQAEVPV